MKAIWKILGAALVVGLTPYKVEKNEETGEKSYQSLLCRITSTPGEGEKEKNIGINLGEGTLTSLLHNQAEEPHLFSDELCVEYTGAPVAEEPAQPEKPTEPESPAEAPAETAAAEEKEKA